MRRHRTQLLLDQDQYEAMVLIARKQERSISDLAREFIELGVAAWKRNQEQRLRHLDELDAFRQRLHARSTELADDLSADDLLAESREERARQTDEVLGWGEKE